MSPECDLLLWAAADNGSISNLGLLRNHISFLGTIFDKVRAREDLRGGTNGCAQKNYQTSSGRPAMTEVSDDDFQLDRYSGSFRYSAIKQKNAGRNFPD
ncbi:hypothetical protein TNCV_4361261 [Trichonephila clavipes]|nr:hypothetical protein TNCV_4361261 [Trichonephila clavipes]